MTNYNIAKGLSNSCDSAVLSAFNAIDQKWVSARVAKQRFMTRFAMTMNFQLNDEVVNKQQNEVGLPSLKSKYLRETTIVYNDPAIYSKVDKPSEFLGGSIELAKFQRTHLRYGNSARRMGLEGKVTVGFIVEIDGTLSNIKLIKGFNGDCETESMKYIHSMPKWNPAEKDGRKVRHSTELTMTFKLAE